MGDFQDPTAFKIGEFKWPNTHPIGDSQHSTHQYPNVAFNGVHPTIAQFIGGAPQGLGPNDKWMMVTDLGRWPPC